MYIAITGRQQEISVAELERIFGPGAVEIISSDAVSVDNGQASEIFPHIGGTKKLVEMIAEKRQADIGEIAGLVSSLPADVLLNEQSKTKISVGASLYGGQASTDDANRLTSALSKAISAASKKVRQVPIKSPRLNTAQVFHNRLDDPSKGVELVIVYGDDKVLIGRTVAVQNLTKYRVRDRDRPRRDTKVGMLPPKLAQIMLNLAAAPLGTHYSLLTTKDLKPRVLDPFCGTGVVLQEALMMGLDAYGTDISERMIDYTKSNLEWLHKPKDAKWKVEVADATSFEWEKPIDLVASEMFLGEPLTARPSRSELDRLKSENYELLASFLKNLYGQIESRTPVCLAVPAWRGQRGFEAAVGFDDLEKLGYNQVRFKHVDNEGLIYARSGQFTGRKLLVLMKQQQL